MRRRARRLYNFLMDSSYKDTLDWLFTQVPMFQQVGASAYKPGLERVTALSDAFGSPHEGLRCIHVAGTNGKGSTASTIAAVLQSAGLRTGLFTSPHLVDFRERIRVDGRMIPEEQVVAFIRRYRDMRLPLEPSFFELTTVMAFEHFRRSGVDIAVVEAGLGGRLDSTNIISPDLCVITNISLDHTALLGSTPEAIAAEKAGIIKPGVPVVIGRADGAVRDVFARKAAQAGAPVIFAQDTPAYTGMRRSDTSVTYLGTPWGDIESQLTGDCQPENADTVFHALGLLPPLSPRAVADGFARVCDLTGLTGRWTVLRRDPLLVCDTGHNPGGWEYLAPRLSEMAARRPLNIVLGFVSDKDAASILATLPHRARYFFVTPSVPRGRDSADLRRQAAEFGLAGDAWPTVEAGVEAALATGRDTFVGGSTFVVADLLTKFNGRESLHSQN